MNDLGKAFTFPFKDPNWLSKLLVGALFLILSIFVVGIFIIAGYFVQTIQRVMRREENALPEWTDIGVMLVVGFKFCVVYLLYVVPILLIMTPVFAISILSALTADDSPQSLRRHGDDAELGSRDPLCHCLHDYPADCCNTICSPGEHG